LTTQGSSERIGPSFQTEMKVSLAALIVVECALALFAAGCASNRPFRTDVPPSDPAHAVIESTPNYKLGYVEFDDQGWFWNTNQALTVEQMIRTEAGVGQSNNGHTTFNAATQKHDLHEADSPPLRESILNVQSQREKWHPNNRIAAMYHFDDTRPMRRIIQSKKDPCAQSHGLN
jgi:hypothetical protein